MRIWCRGNTLSFQVGVTSSSLVIRSKINIKECSMTTKPKPNDGINCPGCGQWCPTIADLEVHEKIVHKK
jgi:hypothetical protein